MTSENDTAFESMALSQELLRALTEKNYLRASPIQAATIPHLLEGRDLIGCAQTGTGKTAAFALPILHQMQLRPKSRVPKLPRALILAPTRELAVQIGDSFATYGKHLPFTHVTIFGGVGEVPQIRALARGVDIVVATPGRLLDLMRSKHLRLQGVEMFVLDEADRMLDMGFAPDVKRIIAELPSRRQSMLFSATMPEAIRSLASTLLSNPVSVEVTPVSSTVERVDQRVCHVARVDKPRFLTETLRKHGDGLTLIFSRTKHGANRIAENLSRAGIRAGAIHGNKSQGARQRVLEEFRTGVVRVLVATDIAARGIDVKGISLVINFDIPVEPESYVHRIGRTARAGAEGLALSFCDPSERPAIRMIERLIRQTIPVHGQAPGPEPRDSRPSDSAPRSERPSGYRPDNRRNGEHKSRPQQQRPSFRFGRSRRGRVATAAA